MEKLLFVRGVIVSYEAMRKGHRRRFGAADRAAHPGRPGCPDCRPERLDPERGERLQDVVVVFRDMSEARHLEEQLQQAQKMEALGTLAGGIAHDFNNILAAVLGYAELAQGEMLMGSPQWLLLQRVLTAGLRAKALVLQILTFSHCTPAERIPVSLAVMLRETLPFLRALLPATVALEAHLTPEATLVLADATQMH